MMPIIKTFIVEDSQIIRDSLIATLEEMVPVNVVGGSRISGSYPRNVN